MPISGIVISCKPEDRDQLLVQLESIASMELHGADDRGNIVAVLETTTTDEMESVMKEVSGLERVLHVGLTYLNTEDETERILTGEYSPEIFGRRKNEKL